MAEVEDITQEEADSMSPADPTPLTGPQMKALLLSKGVAVDSMVEKEELRSLVRQHATRTDMHEFLARARAANAAASASAASSSSRGGSAPRSAPSNSSASSSSSPSSPGPLAAELAAFADLMKRNAAVVRQNPSLFRAQAPEPLKSYTDAQIFGYADQCDRIATDPVLLKQAHAQHMAQQQRGGGGGGGGGAGGGGGFLGLGQIGNWTEAELDAFVAEVKRDPAALRAQMIVAGRQFNMDEAKVDQILGMINNMEPATVKMMLRFGQRFHGVVTKCKAACVRAFVVWRDERCPASVSSFFVDRLCVRARARVRVCA
jgi:hypothetical protein